MDIWRLVISWRAEEKLWARHISADQAQQVLTNEHIVVSKKEGATASHLLIGRDHGGRCLTLPMVETSDRGTWAVVTGWPSAPREEARLGRAGRT